MKRVNHKLFLFCLSVLLIAQTSCKKFIEVEAPATSLTSDNVYQDDATAAAVLTNIYATLSGRSPMNGQNISSISLITGLSADELSLYGGSANANQALGRYNMYILNAGVAGSSTPTIWSSLYAQIYIANL